MAKAKVIGYDQGYIQINWKSSAMTQQWEVLAAEKH